jgi:hypothetical protein
MQQNIILQYLIWQFFDVPRQLLLAWKNFLLFNLNYFSVPLLLRTFFSPWRRYKWSYGKGFDARRYLEVFFSNLTSRILGAIVRSFLVAAGLIVEILIIFSGLIAFFGWLLLPLLLIWGFIFGLKVIF